MAFGSWEAESRRKLNIAKTQRLELEMRKIQEGWIPFNEVNWLMENYHKGFVHVLKSYWNKVLHTDATDRLMDELKHVLREVHKVYVRHHKTESKERQKAEKASRPSKPGGAHRRHGRDG